MEVKILCPLWGHEHLSLKAFLDKIRVAGYDGIETWLPANPADRHLLYDYVQRHELCLVTHQHSAEGRSFTEFRQSFLHNLEACAESRPLLINSHTGRDYFTLQQHLDLIETAQEFSAHAGLVVAHETHRGRMGYCPQMMRALLEKNQEFCLTADLSHWVCVTESMLEHFTDVLGEVLARSRHIHARVGFEQGPQVPDPRAPEYQYALVHFLRWWDTIVSTNRANGCKILPITTEFGPAPYMPRLPFSDTPIADQFDVNCFMKDLLRARY